MPLKVIINSSCLIALEKIDRIDLLCKLFKEVVVPTDVELEFGVFEIPCKTIIGVNEDKKRIFVEDLNLGKGEAAVLALALETGDTCVIDDQKARKVAFKMNIKITGTIGILLRAEKEELIPSAYSAVKDLKEKGFFVNDKILEKLKNRR